MKAVKSSGAGLTGCGITPILSFRGRILPEESAFFLGFSKKQIPRCARDDNRKYFFRSLFSLWILVARNLHLGTTKTHRLKPALLKPAAAIGDPPTQPCKWDGRTQSPPKRQCH